MPASVPLFQSAALRKLEAQACAALGGDAFELMRRAGHAAWRHVLEHWPQAQRIMVVCGPGNNGGDGYVLARHARESGREVAVVRLAVHAPRTELARRACDAYMGQGGRVLEFDGELPMVDLVVDALFGIGLSRPPDAAAALLIAKIDAVGKPVLALDVASGVDADSGDVPGAAICATRTLQFIAEHAGLRTGNALEHGGVLALAALDAPAAAWDRIAPCAYLLQPAMLAGFLPARRRNSHKGEHGHVLCIGGDAGMGGAIALCAEAALRCGAGLSSVATRAAHVAAVLARRPEGMVAGVESASDLDPMLERADIVACGPGLGRGDWGRELFDAALSCGKPLVLDADALFHLAAAPRELEDAVITPHPGEAARLLGDDATSLRTDRYGAAQALAARYRCAVVLKGAGSIVTAPGMAPCVVDAGNPGMASGGMGDVLTGVIAALHAQGMATFDAACCGALLHACAGDMAALEGERGLLASDLFACLRKLANPSSRA